MTAYVCIRCREEPSLAGQLYGSRCMATLQQRRTLEIAEAVDAKLRGKGENR